MYAIFPEARGYTLFVGQRWGAWLNYYQIPVQELGRESRQMEYAEIPLSTGVWVTT